MANGDSEDRKLAPFEDTECRLLVVDDDRACLDEYCELIGNLGYACQAADSAEAALRAVASDRRIGIVITDLKMPSIDGITLLDELANRFAPDRPLVTLVVTGHSSLDNAVKAMRSSAVDFLTKPIGLQDLSASLRLATARWYKLAAQFQLLTMSRTLPAPTAQDPGVMQSEPRKRPSVDELQNFATRMMKSRQSRAKFVDVQNLSEPAWDILLDLTAAGLKGLPVATSSACASTQVPLSTALRHVNQLVEAGLITRTLDPGDRRRTLLELDPQTLELMTRYLASTWEVLDPTPHPSSLSQS